MIMKVRISILSFLVISPLYFNAAPANTVVATVNVGVTPAGIAITPDSKYAYVVNNNNYTISDGSGSSSVNADSVSVIDLTNNSLVTTIFDTSFDQPYTVTINPAGTIAYVTNSNSTTITMINIATNTVTGTIINFDGPSGMVITSDGLTGYVNNYGAGHPAQSGNGMTVSVVNLVPVTPVIIDTITVGLAPAALAISSDGAHVYVVNYESGNPDAGTLSIIQTSNNSVVTSSATLDLSGPFAIAITPDDAYAYVTNFGSNNFTPIGTTVTVLDLSDNPVTVFTTINLGMQPSGIAITPDGKFAYASNYNSLYNPYGVPPAYTDNINVLVPGQGTVNIIDIATNTVLSPTISVGQSPANVAISPDGNYAYVSNFTSNTVNVIALQTFQIVAQGSQIQNRYLTQTELVNKLTWTVSGNSLPVSYTIYRDAGLTNVAGTVLANGPFIFYDYNRLPNTTYTYYIVGTNNVGTMSEPVIVVIS